MWVWWPVFWCVALASSAPLPPSPYSPLIALGANQCNTINSFAVYSAVPANTCSQVVTSQGTVYVLHDCSVTGLIQLFTSSSCSDAPIVQSMQPFCDEAINIGICCAASDTSPASGTGGGQGWPLRQCQQTSAPSVPNTFCRPIIAIDKALCQKKLANCKQQGRQMKWTGVGCTLGKQRFQDGGCQCNHYCGYGCKKPCVRDKQCRWQFGQCVHIRGKTVVGGQVCQD